MSDLFDPAAAAALLRALAEELRTSSSGAARNGLFLELHRLLDTIFRLTLESHPALPPELQGAAFNLESSMPAPQVVRELNRLGSPLAETQIRNLYKHMNMARNNMAHDSAIARVSISNSNVKRMGELVKLVADVLAPDGAPRAPAVNAPPRFALSPARVALLLGAAAGGALAWGVAQPPLVAVGAVVVAVALFVGVWRFSE